MCVHVDTSAQQAEYKASNDLVLREASWLGEAGEGRHLASLAGFHLGSGSIPYHAPIVMHASSFVLSRCISYDLHGPIIIMLPWAGCVMQYVTPHDTRYGIHYNCMGQLNRNKPQLFGCSAQTKARPARIG